jgi:hypothetical protein
MKKQIQLAEIMGRYKKWNIKLVIYLIKI